MEKGGGRKITEEARKMEEARKNRMKEGEGARMKWC